MTDGRDLAVAKFFFWKPGTPKQKSLDGLLRSLLHGVFKSRPELIPEVMPDMWKEARAALWQVQTDLLLREKDVRSAFGRFIGNTAMDTKHCFCFFIDGLDEYQETTQNDVKELVKLLTSWTTTAPRYVKLCVSSREHNVFMNAFSAEQRFRLHDLTRFDMAAYAHGKLGHISDPDAKRRLIRTIIGKAQGNFLWVALVVKQMRDQLENGADFTTLLQLLDSLPDELESLYAHTLKSLSKSDRRRAYQTMAIVSLSTQWGLPVDLVAYSFLDKYDADAAFAERDDFIEKGRGGHDTEGPSRTGPEAS